jgi:two-component system chemotaxis response regulator CheY
MKVLVVDDSSTMRRIIGNCLRSGGEHEIFEAEDGAEAMARLQEMEQADLILTDWNMPNVNGLEFIKQVMESPYKSIPIIMVTTEAEKAKVVEALRAGAKNYVVKPFTPEVLKEKIAQVTGGM